ncbi:MAG: polysaccharide deacetylase family protein [bacterium]
MDRPESLLDQHISTIEAYFREHPPATIKEAMEVLNKRTGIKRSEVRIGVFLKRAELKCRKVGMVPSNVKTLVDNGHTVGYHSHSHAILTTLEPNKSYCELRVSKEMIEKETGMACIAFSYPNGEMPDFREFHQDQLRELGYHLSFSQIPLFNDNHTNPYGLRRINVCQKMSLPVLEATLCGFKK